MFLYIIDLYIVHLSHKVHQENIFLTYSMGVPICLTGEVFSTKLWVVNVCLCHLIFAELDVLTVSMLLTLTYSEIDGSISLNVKSSPPLPKLPSLSTSDSLDTHSRWLGNKYVESESSSSSNSRSGPSKNPKFRLHSTTF